MKGEKKEVVVAHCYCSRYNNSNLSKVTTCARSRPAKSDDEDDDDDDASSCRSLSSPKSKNAEKVPCKVKVEG